MKIILITHLYAPTRLSGSEIYAHNLLKYLQSKGHDVRVLLMPFDGYLPDIAYEYDGVEVFPARGPLEVHYTRADVILCHLIHTRWAIHMGTIYKKPVFHITHSDQRKDCIDDSNCYVIYNSENGKAALNYTRPSVVVHPIIRQFDVPNPEKNKYITLINLNENKGPGVFYDIARALPKYQFLAVKGTYGEQIVENLPNVRIMEPTTDIGAVFSQTRILLMPSEQESFGITAAEAMKAGIPVICTPTPGLKENCGEAGIYCERANIEQWVSEIRKLDNKKTYLSRSEICKERPGAFNSEKELSELEIFIQTAVSNGRDLLQRHRTY